MDVFNRYTCIVCICQVKGRICNNKCLK